MKFYKRFPKDVVLASASPRRKELLSALIPEFSVVPADIDEKTVEARFPSVLVKRLSKQKAAAVSEREDCSDKTIIAADTVVYLDKIYGKPGNYDNSIDMLRKLSGRVHSVYTGVTLRYRNCTRTFYDRSKVAFKKLSDAEIINYVREFEPYDKAGAYGIQDKRIVFGFRGSYTNIVGLPLEKLNKLLIKTGVTNGDNRTFYRSGE